MLLHAMEHIHSPRYYRPLSMCMSFKGLPLGHILMDHISANSWITSVQKPWITSVQKSWITTVQKSWITTVQKPWIISMQKSAVQHGAWSRTTTRSVGAEALKQDTEHGTSYKEAEFAVILQQHEALLATS